MIFSSFKAISAGQAVKRAPLAGNVDDPEGSLDALMQVQYIKYYMYNRCRKNLTVGAGRSLQNYSRCR